MLKCEICEKVFKWQRDVQRHFTLVHGEAKTDCDICGKPIKNDKNEFKRHRLTDELSNPIRRCKFECRVRQNSSTNNNSE